MLTRFPAKVIVFDLNGTLLNTEAVAPKLRRAFGSKYSVTEWFTELLQYSKAFTLAGQYRDFGELAGAVLQMAANVRHVKLSPADIERLRNALRDIPPFPDVVQSLRDLRNAGLRLSVLSNSSASSVPQQLAN